MNRSEVLDAIREQIGEENLSGSYRREGCQMYMTDVPSPRVIADADLAFPAHNLSGKKCDFILFLFENAEKLLTIPVELKGGNVDASEAHEQLQQGADFAARVMPKSLTSVCRPVLIHGKGLHTQQRITLNRAKIRFRGQELTIKTARCKNRGNLAQALKE